MIPKPKMKLRFRKDGTFHILMISDFHGHNQCSPQLKEGIDALLDCACPDMVLLGGDQLGAITPERLYNYLASALSTVEDRRIPWAHVYGNHDREQPMSTEAQQPVYERFPCCLSSRGPEGVSGVGNYVLPVLSSDESRVAYNIWALDSFREYPDYQAAFRRPQYTYLLPHNFADGHVQASPMFDQSLWYYQTSLAMERELGYGVPAIMYMHVPLIEMNLIPRNPEACHMEGEARESVASSEMNCGLFMACQQRGDVQGIFFGHEHLNNFSGNLFGITMAYDSAVGYDMTTDDDMRGGREIILSQTPGAPLFTRHIKLVDIMGDRAFRRFPKRSAVL